MRAHDALPERYNAAHWFVGRHLEEGRGEHAAIITDRERISHREMDHRLVLDDCEPRIVIHAPERG